jgi:large subunit ribosomal protein L40e
MSFEVQPTDIIEKLKLQIEQKLDVSPFLQRLRFQGHQLEDGRRFNHYHVQNESTIHLLCGRSVSSKHK